MGCGCNGSKITKKQVIRTKNNTVNKVSRINNVSHVTVSRQSQSVILCPKCNSVAMTVNIAGNERVQCTNCRFIIR